MSCKYSNPSCGSGGDEGDFQCSGCTDDRHRDETAQLRADLAAARADRDALALAAATRIAKGCSDTCSYLLGKEHACDCGHTALTVALVNMARDLTDDESAALAKVQR